MRALFLPFAAALMVTACYNRDPLERDDSRYYIMCIGDSRVDGDRPNYESYRYEFWKRLVNSSYRFEFAGGHDDGDQAVGYDDYGRQSFDDRHEGIAGDQTTDVLERLNEALEQVGGVGPDIILLGIGINDLLNGKSVEATIKNVHQIVDRIQEKNPKVTIFIEQIAPGKTTFMTAGLGQQLDQYNTEIAHLATERQTAASKVVAVDMASNWQDAYLADVVHYNVQGAQVVADRYFAALQDHVPVKKTQ